MCVCVFLIRIDNFPLTSFSIVSIQMNKWVLVFVVYIKYELNDMIWVEYAQDNSLIHFRPEAYL